MVGVADVNVAGGDVGALDLCMAAQAEVGVVINEHFLINGTVGIVTDGAAFAQGFVLKDKWTGLVLVTLGAALILSSHCQAAFGFENVTAVRVVAVDAIHVTFDDRVMLRQIELALDIEMALKTAVRFFPRVDNESGAAAGTDMFAAGTMAGFAAAHAGHGRISNMQAGVRAGWKFADNFCMTIGAGLVADVMRAGNFQGSHDGTRCSARNQKKPDAARKPQKEGRCKCSLRFQQLYFPVTTASHVAVALTISATISSDKSLPAWRHL